MEQLVHRLGSLVAEGVEDPVILPSRSQLPDLSQDQFVVNLQPQRDDTQIPLMQTCIEEHGPDVCLICNKNQQMLAPGPGVAGTEFSNRAEGILLNLAACWPSIREIYYVLKIRLQKVTHGSGLRFK
eukprot:SAG31_NODE_609_length_13567_cov_18.101574_3_plen_127_part_00